MAKITSVKSKLSSDELDRMLGSDTITPISATNTKQTLNDVSATNTE